MDLKHWSDEIHRMVESGRDMAQFSIDAALSSARDVGGIKMIISNCRFVTPSLKMCWHESGKSGQRNAKRWHRNLHPFKIRYSLPIISHILIVFHRCNNSWKLNVVLELRPQMPLLGNEASTRRRSLHSRWSLTALPS